MAARVINQDPAHRPGGDGIEVSAALPAYGSLLHKFEISLVDQSSGLKSVIGTLAPHVPSGQPVQLVVHQGSQLGRGLSVALSPFNQKQRDITG
jgi:hypothetical protein